MVKAVFDGVVLAESDDVRRVEGMVYFPEEFSGCFDHGDHDGFRNDRVTCPACPAPLRLPPARGGGAWPAVPGADHARVSRSSTWTSLKTVVTLPPAKSSSRGFESCSRSLSA